jgi:hypothetical protein
MRYRSRSDAAQFSSDVAAFVNLLGQAEYLQLLLKLGAGLNHKGYVTEIDDLRFSLELQLLNLELLRIQEKGAFSGVPGHLRLTLSSGLARPSPTCPKERSESFAANSWAASRPMV